MLVAKETILSQGPLPFSREVLEGNVPLSALGPRKQGGYTLTLSVLSSSTDPPVQPQLAHDAQNVHFPAGLQLLTANSGGDEAASPANPCTGHSQGGDREVTGDQGTWGPGEWGNIGDRGPGNMGAGP